MRKGCDYSCVLTRVGVLFALLILEAIPVGINLSRVQPCWAGLRWNGKRIVTPGLPGSGLGDWLIFNPHKDSIVTETRHTFQDSRYSPRYKHIALKIYKNCMDCQPLVQMSIKFFLMKFWSSQKKRETTHSLIAGGIVMRGSLSGQQPPQGIFASIWLALTGFSLRAGNQLKTGYFQIQAVYHWGKMG